MPSMDKNLNAISGLISKINKLTGKSDVDISAAIDTLIENQGSIPGPGIPDFGDCTELHVIDVTELPTENIVEDAIYRVKEEKCVDVGMVTDDGQYISISVLIMAFLGEPIPLCIYNVDSLDSVENPVSSIIHWYYCRADRTLYSYNSNINDWDAADGKDDDSFPGLTPSWKVKDDYAYYQYHNEPFRDIALVYDMEGIPTTMSVSNLIPEAQTTFNTIPAKIHDDSIRTSVFDNSDTEEFHFYYIESEQDIFVYGDPGATGADDWHKLTDIGNEDSGMAGKYFNGFVLDETEATKEGYYAIGGSGWKKHVRTRGTLLLTEPDQTEDVTEFSKVRCVAPHVIDVTTLPETVPVSDNIYYYVESENDIFLHCEVVTYSSENYIETEVKWITLGEVESDIALNLSFKGTISSQDAATEPGYYAVIIEDNFTDIIANIDGFPISLAATASLEGRSIELCKVNIKPTDNVDAHSIYAMNGRFYSYNTNDYTWREYLEPSGTVTISINGPHDVTGYKTANVNVPTPTIIEAPSKITENGTYTASMFGANGISKVTVDVHETTSLAHPMYGTITLKDNLDFSMVEDKWASTVHYAICSMGNELYVGLRIGAGTLSAIKLTSLTDTAEVVLYDNNGWKDTTSQVFVFPADTLMPAINGVLFAFLKANVDTDSEPESADIPAGVYTFNEIPETPTWTEQAINFKIKNSEVVYTVMKIGKNTSNQKCLWCQREIDGSTYAYPMFNYSTNSWEMDGGRQVTILEEVNASTEYSKWFTNSTRPGGMDAISFTINDVTYYADTGMSWTQWVNSAYNTGGYTVESGSGRVLSSAGNTVGTSTGSTVIGGQTIAANGVFTHT